LRGFKKGTLAAGQRFKRGVDEIGFAFEPKKARMI